MPELGEGWEWVIPTFFIALAVIGGLIMLIGDD